MTLSMEKSKNTILVVEDEDDIRSGIVESIDKSKFFVFEASNGKEAIEKAKDIFNWCEFGIVLLDIKLPDMSGLDVLKTIKSENYNLCIIMLTALNDNSYAVKAMQEGASDYITKPFTIKTLRDKLEKLNQTVEMEKNLFFANNALFNWRADFDKRYLEAKMKEKEKLEKMGERLTIEEYISIVHPPAKNENEFEDLEQIENEIKNKFKTNYQKTNKKAKVLVVEDEDDIRSGIVEILSKEFEVAEAATYKEALAKVQSESFDLALLDIVLPDGNGIDLLAEIKKISKDIICIMLTALKDVKFTVKAMQNGAYNYLTKPFSYAELISSVKKPIEINERKKIIENLMAEIKQKYMQK